MYVLFFIFKATSGVMGLVGVQNFSDLDQQGAAAFSEKREKGVRLI
jgi:hypothetical protein